MAEIPHTCHPDEQGYDTRCKACVAKCHCRGSKECVRCWIKRVRRERL